MTGWLRVSEVAGDLNGALSGTRVLDFSALAPGPFATLILAEMGADVIAVNRPGEETKTNSYLRRLARQVSLDLKSRDDHSTAIGLMAEADIVVDGFRPGVAQRLGIDFESAREINPNVIYCSITGFGNNGPARNLAGHDLNYLSMSGFSSLTGNHEDGPAVPLNLIADIAAGSLQAVVAILGAMLDRARHREARLLEISMTDGIIAMLSPLLSRFDFGAGSVPGPGEHLLAGGSPYYRHYRCADGLWLAVAAIESKFYENLCEALELDHLRAAHGDPEHWPTAIAQLQEHFAKHERQYWLDLFAGIDVCVTPVLTVAEALSNTGINVGAGGSDGVNLSACPGAWPLWPSSRVALSVADRNDG